MKSILTLPRLLSEIVAKSSNPERALMGIKSE